MNFDNLIYEGPYSSVKKIIENDKVLVKKKFAYKKYRSKEDLEKIHLKC